ncbi:MAG: hypothetical protein PHP64_07390 [Actinomycetota bacterium]|nr:hypothetical protein [Actinomycetota bacterium]
MRIEGTELLKRAWEIFRRNHFLWVIGFLMALGGGSAPDISLNFNLWIKSPIPRGLTGYAPIFEFADKIGEAARENPALHSTLIFFGFLVALLFLILRIYSQACAIRAVSEIEEGSTPNFSGSLKLGKNTFFKYLILFLMFAAATGAASIPFMIFLRVFGGKKWSILPFAFSVILGLILAVCVVVFGMVFELAARMLVINEEEITGSVRGAISLLRDFWRECLFVWILTLFISIAGAIVIAIILGIIGIPISSLSDVVKEHQNFLLISLSIPVLVAAWSFISFFSGLFSVYSSALWTILSRELK